jgi:23S rRNA pseudouridine955/2504/2580 synthase
MNTPTKVQLVEINQERAGQRLDNYLVSTIKGVPKSRFYRAIRKGEVRVNKKRVKADYKIQAGDVIRIPPLHVREQQPVDISQNAQQSLLDRILYEDDSVVVLNKPAGMPVHGGTNASYGVINALRLAKPDCRYLELVHRLDKATSGCLLIAKKRSALRALHEQIRHGKINKHYLCLAQGQWQGKKRKVNVALRKNTLSSGERLVRVDREGKEALTEFSLEQQYSEASLLKAILHTGRTHQIRVHLQHIEHYLAGDEKYGDRNFNKQMRSFGLKRMFLHASQLKFQLPNQEKAITVSAPLEKELQQCLNNLN